MVIRSSDDSVITIQVFREKAQTDEEEHKLAAMD
jgi:hypothetical protein